MLHFVITRTRSELFEQGFFMSCWEVLISKMFFLKKRELWNFLAYFSSSSTDNKHIHTQRKEEAPVSTKPNIIIEELPRIVIVEAKW